MEFCCAYEYDQTRKWTTPLDFPGPSKVHQISQEVWGFTRRETLSQAKPISG